MSITATSRYSKSTVIPATNLDGADIMVILFDEPVDTSFQFTMIQIEGHHNVDQLAFAQYGDPTLWWVIANANPEITDWSSLPIGALLRIPNAASVVS